MGTTKFGIQQETMDETTYGNYIQNVKLTAKADKQEIRGSCGTVRAVVFSKKTLEIEFTHFGKPKTSLTDAMGAAKSSTFTAMPASTFASAAEDFIEDVGQIYLEEITAEQSNTEATKTTVKAVGYVSIS